MPQNSILEEECLARANQPYNFLQGTDWGCRCGFRRNCREIGENGEYLCCPRWGRQGVVEGNPIVEHVFHGALNGLHSQVEGQEKVPVGALPVGDQLVHVGVVLAAGASRAMAAVDEYRRRGAGPVRAMTCSRLVGTLFKLFNQLRVPSGGCR